MTRCAPPARPVFLLVLLCLTGCGQAASPERQAASGAPAAGPAAPVLDLSDLAGNPISLADYKGRPVIVNFWATWCGPCREELPSLIALYRELSADGLEVIAVATDGDRAAVEQFLRATPLPFRVAVDQDGSVSQRYAVATVPTSFLLDGTGAVVERVDGKVDWTRADLIGAVRALAHSG